MRPEYVDRPAPTPFSGSEVKDEETIERMRVAGRVAAQALALCGEMVRPGVTTDEIDRAGHEFLLDHGMLDLVVDRRELKAAIARALRFGLPADGPARTVPVTPLPS